MQLMALAFDEGLQAVNLSLNTSEQTQLGSLTGKLRALLKNLLPQVRYFLLCYASPGQQDQRVDIVPGNRRLNSPLRIVRHFKERWVLIHDEARTNVRQQRRA